MLSWAKQQCSTPANETCLVFPPQNGVYGPGLSSARADCAGDCVLSGPWRWGSETWTWNSRGQGETCRMATRPHAVATAEKRFMLAWTHPSQLVCGARICTFSTCLYKHDGRSSSGLRQTCSWLGFVVTCDIPHFVHGRLPVHTPDLRR